MSTSWQLNGTDLTTGTVTVVVEAAPDVIQEEKVRWQREKVLHDTEVEHKIGVDLPRVRLRFLFVGAASDRYSAMNTVRRSLLDDDYVYLKAPDAPANSFYWPRGLKEAYLQPETLRVVHLGGVSAVALECEFVYREELQTFAATVTGGGDIVATARRELEAVVVLSGGGDIVAIPFKISVGVAQVTGGGDVTCLAFVIRPFSAAVTGGGDIVATALLLTNLLQENGDALLQENDDNILAEL